jgi:hypothetical protein
MAMYEVTDDDGQIRQIVAEESFVKAHFTNYRLVDNQPTSEAKSLQKAARRAAYQRESDPLFFMSQRGEATIEEWQAKIAEIKARYPYPVE